MKRYIVVILSVFLLIGCAGQKLVQYHPDALIDTQIDPYPNQELEGKMVVLGGVVSSLEHDGPYSRVEVVRHRLNDRGYPIINQAIDGDRVIFILSRRVSLFQNQVGDLFSGVGTVSTVTESDFAGKKVRMIMVRTDKYQFWEKFDRRYIDYEDRYFNSFGFGYYPRRVGIGFGYGRYYW